MARKTTYDQDLVKEVRMTALAGILEILKESARSKEFGKDKKEMLFRLSTSVLPRLTELSGKEGGAIQLEGVNITIQQK